MTGPLFPPYRIYLASWPSSHVTATCATASNPSTLPTRTQGCGACTRSANQPRLQRCCVLFRRNGERTVQSRAGLVLQPCFFVPYGDDSWQGQTHRGLPQTGTSPHPRPLPPATAAVRAGNCTFSRNLGTRTGTAGKRDCSVASVAKASQPRCVTPRFKIWQVACGPLGVCPELAESQDNQVFLKLWAVCS